MASTSSISGLVSGLDTATLITQLMQVAAAPQTRLQNSLAATNQRISAAQEINSKAASMTTAAAVLTDASLYTTAKTTSSSSAVTATVTGSPPAGSLTFTVTRLAATHSIATGSIDPSGTSDITITTGVDTDSAVVHTIKAKSHSAADLVAAINGTTDLGVTARVVTDSGQQDRIILTAAATGAASKFSIAGLNSLADGSDDRGSALSTGQDAEVLLGTPGAGVSVTSSTNTFKNLIAGVELTVTSDPKASVTITTATDPKVVASAVTSLVASMNTLLERTSFHMTLPPSGVASLAAGGLLAANGTMRDLAKQVLDAVSADVGDNSAALAGLEVTREGGVQFLPEKFDAFYANHPIQAQAVLKAFGTAVQSVGKGASASSTGSVTAYITGSQRSVKDLGDRISDWDTRLADKRATLTAQYTALETALSRLKSQSDSLTQALSGLTSSNS